MPLIGSPREVKDARLSGLRMWPVEGFPSHLIFYLPQEDGIEVIRVLHGARELRRILEAEE
jgi:toxin ParE1/3/4